MRSPRSVRRWASVLAVLSLLGLSAVMGATPAQAASGDYWVQRLELSKVWKITRGAGVTVAVVDSGVPPVANLRGRLLKGVDLASHGASGQIDAGESTADGPVSHGQEMAQAVAGDSRGGLTEGIAPAAKILPVKIGVSGTTFPEATADAGIRWAVDHGAQVINASFSTDGSSCSPGDQAAVKYAYDHDVIVVAATGNSGTPVGTPANCAGALAVAGVTPNGSNWPGSNFGPEVAVANFATDVPFHTLNGNAIGGQGTSEATAFTSGEIALLRAKFPHDSAREIVTRLLYGIDPLSKTAIGQRVDDHIGYGVPAVYSELTAKVPANAPNPIYDAWAKTLGTPTTGSSAPAASTPPSTSTSGPSGSAPSSDAPVAASGGSGGSNSTLIIVLVVVVVLVLIVLAVVFSRRTRNRKGPYPPAGYGLPPSGGPPRQR